MMNPTMMLAICSIAITLPLSACKATDPALDATKDAAAALILPPAQERVLGERMAAEIERDLNVHQDEAVQAYIDRLGARVALEAAPRLDEGIALRFTVIDDPRTVNAFAIPGGHIYVYSGLLLNASNEAEIVGVLGHEAAHVTERHVAERMAATFGVETLTGIALGGDAPALARVVTSLASQGYLLRYSRRQEREADRVGLAYVIKAGYDPRGMVAFFDKLGHQPQPPTFLSSHPHPHDRAEALEALIARQGNVPTFTGLSSYRTIEQRLRTPSAAR